MFGDQLLGGHQRSVLLLRALQGGLSTHEDGGSEEVLKVAVVLAERAQADFAAEGRLYVVERATSLHRFFEWHAV